MNIILYESLFDSAFHVNYLTFVCIYYYLGVATTLLWDSYFESK